MCGGQAGETLLDLTRMKILVYVKEVKDNSLTFFGFGCLSFFASSSSGRHWYSCVSLSCKVLRQPRKYEQLVKFARVTGLKLAVV